MKRKARTVSANIDVLKTACHSIGIPANGSKRHLLKRIRRSIDIYEAPTTDLEKAYIERQFYTEVDRGALGFVQKRVWYDVGPMAPSTKAKSELNLNDADLSLLSALHGKRYSKYSAPHRLYPVKSLEKIAARKAIGKHKLLGSKELRKLGQILGEPVTGSRAKVLRRVRELIVSMM